MNVVGHWRGLDHNFGKFSQKSDSGGGFIGVPLTLPVPSFLAQMDTELGTGRASGTRQYPTLPQMMTKKLLLDSPVSLCPWRATLYIDSQEAAAWLSKLARGETSER